MRTRSHWGWGHADRFPNAQARTMLGRHLATLLSVDPPTPIEPMPLDAIKVPANRVQPPSALASFCTTERVARIYRTYGRSYLEQLRGFEGCFDTPPDVVARPSTIDELTAVLDWASGARVAVVPYGGGTSVVGGVSYDGAGHVGVVCLDMGGFDQVYAIDEVSRLAHLGAGLFGPQLEQALAEEGLTLRHFPQSFEFSTLGGWIATRAGGHFATVYTHIDDLVAGTRMLTPGAGVMTSRCLPGSGAGPSPDRLVLGSEGAFGIITDAWVRVRPRPRWRARASVHFKAFTDAVAATREIAQSGLFPSNCRLLDRAEALVNSVAFDGSHVLLLGFESADHPLEWPMTRALAIAAEHGGACPKGPRYRDALGDDREARDASQAWKGAFLEGPYLQSALIGLGLIADTFETACTWAGFPALHEAVCTAVGDAMRAVCGTGRISCRFTHVYPDGPAPYYTFIAPGRAGAQAEQWRAIKQAASEALLAHGGTITHHHAVGRLHRPWAQRQWAKGHSVAIRAIKGALDPTGVMNPGALLPIEPPA